MTATIIHTYQRLSGSKVTKMLVLQKTHTLIMLSCNIDSIQKTMTIAATIILDQIVSQARNKAQVTPAIVTSTSTTGTATLFTSKKINVNVADFPSFNRKAETWHGFKDSFLGLIHLEVRLHVLENNDAKHEQLMMVDSEYIEDCKQICGILFVITMKGSALHIIKNNTENYDGYKAFKALCEHYNASSNLQNYISSLLAKNAK